VPIDIVFPAGQWEKLRHHLFGSEETGSQYSGDEQMALLLAGPNRSPEGTRLVVRELLLANPSDLASQSGAGIAPSGEFVADALTRCRQEGWSLIEVHSHPFSTGHATTFSGIDWANDRAKMPELKHLLPEGAVHATMVIGPASLDAHYYDSGLSSIEPVRRVLIHGVRADHPSLIEVYPTQAAMKDGRPFPSMDRYSRQVPLLGSEAQADLAASMVVIVGLGGLGSIVALECAHLGVGHLVLIDPDTVEESNLNRLIGATPASVGEPKVSVYAELCRTVSPEARVTAIRADILDGEALAMAKQSDLLLGCVDSHGARLVMNLLAVQYVIPFIDAGTGARLSDGKGLTHAGGQVQLVLPGLGCLQCRDFIDMRQASFDLAPPHVRQREIDHGYGTREPAPSVVFLNGVVASIQVAEAVKLIARTGSQEGNASPIILYDLLRQSVVRVGSAAVDSCPICGCDGAAGLADLAALHAAGAPSSPPPALLGAAQFDA